MPASAPVTAADAALSAFLQSLEVAVGAAYDRVVPQLSENLAPIASAFQAHHREYATRMATHAGAAAAKGPNGIFAAVITSRLQTVVDQRSALTLAFGLENQLTATYEFALTTLTSPDVIASVATIIPVLAGHSAILGSASAIPPSLVFPNGPFEANTVGDGSDLRLGLDPAVFPTG